MADSLSVRHMCSVCLYHVVRGGLSLSVGDACGRPAVAGMDGWVCLIREQGSQTHLAAAPAPCTPGCFPGSSVDRLSPCVTPVLLSQLGGQVGGVAD